MLKINDVRAYTATETVSVPDCNEGDIVLQHGGLFRLTNRRDWDDGQTATFDGVFLGDAFSDQECGIPAYWRDNQPRQLNGTHGYWQVQGNGFAKIARVTDTAPQYWHGDGWRPMPKLEDWS